MTKSEVSIQVRMEKIKLEHQALLQEMNVILVSLVGLPSAWLTAVNYLNLTSQIGSPFVILVLATVIGAVEWIRERKDDQLKDKRDEMDELLKTWTI
ncbi:MAG: hypothetical protein M1490_04700 [Candidatus Bathyarchaeota archaeon]|nr:hypothetical protein [Candidatus Bathyarchaeota archaeon]